MYHNLWYFVVENFSWYSCISCKTFTNDEFIVQLETEFYFKMEILPAVTLHMLKEHVALDHGSVELVFEKRL